MTRGLPRGELVPSPTVTEHLQHVLPLTINAADLALGDGGPLLFDCRSEEDYDEGHISGATLLPLQQLSLSVDQLRSAANDHIVFYCRSGRRSGAVTEYLRTTGFARCQSLEGGWEEWCAQQA